MTVADAAAAEAWLGEPVSDGGLMMRDARVVRPAAVLEAWLDGAERHAGQVADLRREGDVWRLFDAQGRRLAEAETVVVAAGWGTASLLDQLSLSPVRGQADWVEATAAPAVAWGGYAAPTADGFLYGATHRRGDISLDARDDDSAANLATLAARLPRLAARARAGVRSRRAAVRATTADRLPVVGRVAEGLYVLGGLGSRGFCIAPLLAEHLAATILRRPSPLPVDLAARVSPDRSATRPKPLAEPSSQAQD